MRLVSYNILDGGIGRADPIAEVLLAQRADVIGLVEADDPEVLDRIAWRLGYDYISAPGEEKRTAALLTRGRILESVNHGALPEARRRPRSLLEALLEVDGTQITVFVVHNTGRASIDHERERLAETQYVLDSAAPLREAGRPHVLMGDFNANSPRQEIDPELLAPKSRKWWDANGEMIPREVVRAIEEAGYLDTFAAARPGESRTAATFTTLHPGQRLDYIFAFALPPERIADAWIEQDRLATYASDHYPVGAELATEAPSGPAAAAPAAGAQ